MSGKVGPGKPPRAGQFRKGQSGNPKGRPRKQKEEKSESAFDIIIGQTLTITHNGEPCEVTVEEALQHKTYQEAIGGSRPAIRDVMKMIKKRENEPLRVYRRRFGLSYATMAGSSSMA